ncbi:DinB family protein [Paenibacillus agricola]|uniref:DinB family protein n=1 Tax=Paenibacillus agricola TaxID=2716264 RepID=A0ABX0JMZ1_9BACL|nr:DinB family protein [Paenibacillus agricola]NHN35640.1 DinB family protein [Paenibacillus agricola]
MGIKLAFNYEKSTEEISKLKGIDEQRLLEPIKEGKWSVKEIIGHLYYWDKFILEQHVPNMAEGAKLIAFPDHDLHNKEAIQYIGSYITVESLIDDLIQERKQLIETISGVESTVKFTIGTGKRQFTVEKHLKIFIDHDIHHLKQIEERLN